MSASTLLTTSAGNVLDVQYFPPSGVATGLTFGSNTPGVDFSSANITNVSPFLTATSVISSAIQSATFTDANSCWLMSAVPSSANGGTITFNIYQPPFTPGSYSIAWAVVKF